MLAVNYIDELGKLVGTGSFKVVVLVDVVLEVIKERCSLTDHKFPITLTNADDLCPAVTHLPIEEVVLLLTFGLTKHGGTERDTVISFPQTSP